MKSYVIFSGIVAVLVLLAFLFVGENSRESESVRENNVAVVDGRQIVKIRVKGGYLPRRSVARAGMPTVVRLETNGTFDCSSSVRIPSIGVNKNLPPSGVTDIELGVPTVDSLQGSCGMGMYAFEIVFEK